MTTAAQIKKLVKPLLERNADLAFVQPWIILKPVHHVFRAVYVERFINANCFRPKWLVMHLCEPLRRYLYTWETMLYGPDFRLWTWDNPRVPSVFIDVVEQQALPLMRKIDTLDAFVGFATKERFDLNPFSSHLLGKVAVDVARGDLESARSACTGIATRHQRWQGEPGYDPITKTFCPLIAANDRPALVRLLHEWEATTVKTLGIGHLWEPTPFPIELQASGSGVSPKGIG